MLNPPRTKRSVFAGHPWLSLLLRIGGSIIALAVLFRFLPLAEVWQTLGRLPAHLWLLLIAGYLCAHVVAISKWRMMVNVAGARLTFRQAIRCYFSGLFGTLLLPSIVSGDVVRAAMAFRMGQSKAGIVLGGVIDRSLDFVALVLLAALGAALIPGDLPAQAHRIVFIGGAAIVAAILIALLIVWFPARKLSFRLRRRIIPLRCAARAMRAKPQKVAAALSLGIVIQGSFIWLTSRAAAATDLHLLFRDWLFAWPLAKFCAVIPITQGGIGVREAALVLLLIPFGAPAVKTAAVGLAWEAVIISGGLLAGAVAFLLGRFPRVNAAEVSPQSKFESL